MASSPPRFSSNYYAYAPPPPHNVPYAPPRPPDRERYRSPGAYYPSAPPPPPAYPRYPGPPPYIPRLYLGPPPPHPPAPPLPPRLQPMYGHVHTQPYLPPLPTSPPYPTSRYSFGTDPVHRLPPLQNAFHYHPCHMTPPLLTQQRHAPHDDEEGNVTGASADRVEQWLQRSQTTSRHDSTSASGSHAGGDVDFEDNNMGHIDPSLLADEDENDSIANLAPSPEDPGIGLPDSEKKHNEAYYPGLHLQAQFAELKKNRNYKPSSMNLNSLGDGEPDERPRYHMGIIIKCAILGSPRQRLTLNELYEAIEERFSFFKNVYRKHSWKNSIRHTLSLKQQFIKKPRPITEPGKGHYWVLAPNEPLGNKRERKRHRKLGKRALAAMNEEARQQPPAQPTLPPDPPPVSAYGSTTTTALPMDTTTTTTTLRVKMAHYDKTVPANVGSYAAVTGALPHPAPIDLDSLQPWVGTSEHILVSACQRTAAGQGAVRTTEQQTRLSGPGTSSSSTRPHRTQTKRAERRYNPLSISSTTLRSVNPLPSKQPQDTFNALAAEIAREVGRSGGPAIKRRVKLARHEEDSESDQSDEYLPSARRRMPRRRK